jgi:imidazoleglycerol phosphate synthase cyclase subunit
MTLTTRIIACLDIRDGRVVKGVNFRDLRDAGDPAEQAQRYETEGADELAMLDVSATEEGRGACVRTLAQVREAIGIPISIGGGVRTRRDAIALLDAGADKVVVNSAAVREPALISELADSFGVQCTVVAIDAKLDNGRYRVFTNAAARATDLDAPSWARLCAQRGAGEIVLTSIDRDGTGLGYDVGLIDAVRAATDLPIVASGGAGTLQHLVQAADAGADAVLAASIFHDGVFTIRQAKQALADAGLEVRT